MNKEQFAEVMGYLDSEYAGIVNRMSGDEKKIRLAHWRKEIGNLDYNAVMTAVRKLSKGQYVPRTAEIIAEVESQMPVKTSQNPKCRIFRDADGKEVLDLRHSDGTGFMYGYLSNFPKWMQLKFRWMANPNAENTLAWDNYIMANERPRNDVGELLQEMAE